MRQAAEEVGRERICQESGPPLGQKLKHVQKLLVNKNETLSTKNSKLIINLALSLDKAKGSKV